jgi:hypothetical protein
VNNTDSILAGLDDIKRAEAPPFLYSKIQTRLNACKPGFFRNLNYLISKPFIATSFLFIIFFVDVAVFQSNLKKTIGKSDIVSDEFTTIDDLNEMLFYDIAENDYASIYFY